MLFAPWFLLFLAVALAYPVPILLSRAVWSVKSPVLALFVWQVVALSGGLSTIGAFLVYGLLPLAAEQPRTVNLMTLVMKAFSILFRPEETGNLTANLGVWHLAALNVAILLSVHLIVHLSLSYYRLRQARIKHQNLLNFLATRETIGGDHTQVLVIAHNTPLAYWLPLGIISPVSMTVVSQGLLDKLSQAQLQAVIEHEKTHIKQRHDLLQWAFSAWKSALPWLPTAQKAWISVISLVEITADNHALKTVRNEDLAAVLHYLEDKENIGLLLDTSPYSMLHYRATRLSEQERELNLAAKILIGAAAIALLFITAVLLLFPALV